MRTFMTYRGGLFPSRGQRLQNELKSARLGLGQARSLADTVRRRHAGRLVTWTSFDLGHLRLMHRVAPRQDTELLLRPDRPVRPERLPGWLDAVGATAGTVLAAAAGGRSYLRALHARGVLVSVWPYDGRDDPATWRVLIRHRVDSLSTNRLSRLRTWCSQR